MRNLVSEMLGKDEIARLENLRSREQEEKGRNFAGHWWLNPKLK